MPPRRVEKAQKSRTSRRTPPTPIAHRETIAAARLQAKKRPTLPTDWCVSEPQNTWLAACSEPPPASRCSRPGQTPVQRPNIPKPTTATRSAKSIRSRRQSPMAQKPNPEPRHRLTPTAFRNPTKKPLAAKPTARCRRPTSADWISSQPIPLPTQQPRQRRERRSPPCQP